MASNFMKLHPTSAKQTRNILPLLAVAVLISASYLAGIYLHSRGRASPKFERTSDCNPKRPPSKPTTSALIHNDDSVILDFASHHSAAALLPSAAAKFPVCSSSYIHHTPCEDSGRCPEFQRDRHCPPESEKLRCLVPPPRGYHRPFPWPASRDVAWLANVPHSKNLETNGIRIDGDVVRFAANDAVDAYIKQIERIVSFDDGSIRTAIDIGCRVGSFGANLLSKGITVMSLATRGSNATELQLALERGVPAMIGAMESNRLPYPSRAFDMAHCSRCLVPWHLYGGKYLMEVDRILRPGGYWLLSDPPANGWNRTVDAIASGLCWKKVKQLDEIAIWQKPINHKECRNRTTIKFCNSSNPDSSWNTRMETCLTPLPEVGKAWETAGGEVRMWPERLVAVPPRVLHGSIEGVTGEAFSDDSKLWAKRVSHYKLVEGRSFRNVLDMNAKLGAFAAAMAEDPVWVMNVVPTIATDTLGVIYERGFVGIYHDWCEAMSTCPRSYDLIHSDSLFSLYNERCPVVDILLEMDRILRPEGVAIFRDDVDVLVKVKKIAEGMRWETRFVDHEDGPFLREKILFGFKKHWTIGD